MDVHLDSARIDAMGGATAVATIFGIRPQAVSQWRRDGIPHARRMYLVVTRPDIFGSDAAPVATPKARKAA